MVSASFEPLSPRRIDFERAIEFLAQPALGLRAGDALHLAVAVGAEAGPVVTLDKTMLRAARRLGIEAVDPNG
jgi:predicted nucleic acid-binding protein